MADLNLIYQSAEAHVYLLYRQILKANKLKMSCGIKNSEIPGTPEYGKPYKPENSGGCGSCIKNIDQPQFEPVVLEKTLRVSVRTRASNDIVGHYMPYEYFMVGEYWPTNY